jgi:hypothetical protein
LAAARPIPLRPEYFIKFLRLLFIVIDFIVLVFEYYYELA